MQSWCIEAIVRGWPEYGHSWSIVTASILTNLWLYLEDWQRTCRSITSWRGLTKTGNLLRAVSLEMILLCLVLKKEKAMVDNGIVWRRFKDGCLLGQVDMDHKPSNYLSSSICWSITKKNFGVIRFFKYFFVPCVEPPLWLRIYSLSNHQKVGVN